MFCGSIPRAGTNRGGGHERIRPDAPEKRSAISMASPGEGAIKAKDSACFAAQIALFRAPERIAANARQIDGRQTAPFIIHFRHAVLSVCFDMFS